MRVQAWHLQPDGAIGPNCLKEKGRKSPISSSKSSTSDNLRWMPDAAQAAYSPVGLWCG